MPQVYWTIGFAPADYAKVVSWWAGVVEGIGTQLYAGQANYKVGTSTQSPEWMDPAELSRHLTYNRAFPQVNGDVCFSAKDVRANRLSHMDILAAEHHNPAGPGPGGRAAARRGAAPSGDPGRAAGRGRRAPEVGGRPGQHLLRPLPVDGSRGVAVCEWADAGNLVTTGRLAGGPLHELTDASVRPGQAYTYVLTVLDRTNRESAPSRPHGTMG